jgi:hypothetical protein
MNIKLNLSALLLWLFFDNSCKKEVEAIPGNREGQGITFTVCATCDTNNPAQYVSVRRRILPMYYDLNITDHKFSSERSGNSFLGIPEANLQGEFISRKLAKGTFNGVEWTAMPSGEKTQE